MMAIRGDVRFTPQSGHVRALADVRFVPIADIGRPPRMVAA